MLANGHTTFQESGLSFHFDKRWVVRKYDDHNFYRGLSSAGLKAVDFIGFFGDKIVFLEAKNYTQRSAKKAIEILSDPDPFIEGMLQKVEDSRRGIRAIHQFYERNWIYRKLFPALLRLPLRTWNRATWVFWAQLYEAVWNNGGLAIIFWLEFSDSYEGISPKQQETALANIKSELHRRLAQHGLEAAVYSTQSPPESILVEGLGA